MSFICDLDRSIDALLPAVHRGLDAARHHASYDSAFLLHEPSYLLAASAYPAYPLSAFDFGDVAIHLEGRLYGPAPTEELLRDLIRGLFERDGAAEEWVRDVDGEFVIVAIQRSTARIVILNDRLGRLPLYGQRTSHALLLSRELRFITHLLPRIEYDRMGMAQFLLFGLPLGERTLVAGVKRVAPGTCIRIDVQGRTIRETQASPLNLEPDNPEGAATRDPAHELAALFASACRARAATSGENMVSLSGGADSRSVAACLHRLDIAYDSVTFLDADGDAAADVAVAERLAALFGSPWHLIRLRPPSPLDDTSLLRRKQGLNPLSMSYLMPYLDHVAQQFGRGIVFFTGDGGDKVMPDLRPLTDIADVDAAVGELLRRHQIMPLEHVSALTGVPQAEFLGELRDRLEAYPEERWIDRWVHFAICERAFKWLFEGEDRNRGFFWSTSPFYAAPFFFTAMRVHPAHKAHRALYRDFLLQIAPAAAAVEYAGIGAPIDSAAFRVATKAAALLAEQARGPLRAAPGRPASDSVTLNRRRDAGATVDLVRQQAARSQAITDHLDADAVTAFLDGPAASHPGATDALFTLTSLIEDLASGDDRPPPPECTARPHALAAPTRRAAPASAE